MTDEDFNDENCPLCKDDYGNDDYPIDDSNPSREELVNTMINNDGILLMDRVIQYANLVRLRERITLCLGFLCRLDHVSFEEMLRAEVQDNYEKLKRALDTMNEASHQVRLLKKQLQELGY